MDYPLQTLFLQAGWDFHQGPSCLQVDFQNHIRNVGNQQIRSAAWAANDKDVVGAGLKNLHQLSQEFPPGRFDPEADQLEQIELTVLERERLFKENLQQETAQELGLGAVLATSKLENHHPPMETGSLNGVWNGGILADKNAIEMAKALRLIGVWPDLQLATHAVRTRDMPNNQIAGLRG